MGQTDAAILGVENNCERMETQVTLVTILCRALLSGSDSAKKKYIVPFNVELSFIVLIIIERT